MMPPHLLAIKVMKKVVKKHRIKINLLLKLNELKMIPTCQPSKAL